MTDWDARMADAMLDKRAENDALSFVEPVDSETGEYVTDGVTLPSMAVAPLHVIVVGSTAWDEPLLVQASLLSWAQHHAEQPVYLWTTGAPTGAELEAREFGHRSGWRVNESPADLIVEIEATVVFGFITAGGKAGELLETIATRRPVRQLTLESLRPRSRWNEW